MRIRQHKKMVLALCLAFLLAGGVSYAIATDSTGSVTVEPEVPRITNIAFPSSVDPNSPATLTFTIEYGQGLDNGDEVWVYFWADGYAADRDESGLPPDNLNATSSYFAYWRNSEYSQYNGGWDEYGPQGIGGFTGPSSLPINDGSNLNLGLNITLDELAQYGSWHLEIALKYTRPDTTTGKIEEFQDFNVNAYMDVSINYASFDFGSIEQGQVDIPISNPVSGYLNISVMSNVAYLLKAAGTDPDDGGGNSFSVNNIKQNSVDNVGSAVALQNTAQEIPNGGSYPSGTTVSNLYLWISIPETTPTGTYTFTLSVTATAA